MNAIPASPLNCTWNSTVCLKLAQLHPGTCSTGGTSFSVQPDNCSLVFCGLKLKFIVRHGHYLISFVQKWEEGIITGGVNGDSRTISRVIVELMFQIWNA